MVGAPRHPTFTLTDHFGRAVTEMDFHGRHVLAYFGFTSCRVVCPRALAKLSDVLAGLGEDVASHVHPLYITVDPARDTPQVMQAFLEERYPRFLGLTGSSDEIDHAKASFRVFAERKADADDPEGYQIAHTAIAYLLDETGDYVDHFPDRLDAGTIAARMASHLAKPRPS